MEEVPAGQGQEADPEAGKSTCGQWGFTYLQVRKSLRATRQPGVNFSGLRSPEDSGQSHPGPGLCICSDIVPWALVLAYPQA